MSPLSLLLLPCYNVTFSTKESFDQRKVMAVTNSIYSSFVLRQPLFFVMTAWYIVALKSEQNEFGEKKFHGFLIFNFKIWKQI